jgi:3-hydroxyacyl-[acyl-carrier-protein] dehydratase
MSENISTGKNAKDIQAIMEYLPHRYPFLLIDRVLEMEVGKSLTAIKNVTMNEPFFCGHFPEKPIMPGVMILEALAQASCVLASETINARPGDGYLYLFAGMNDVRFKHMVVPGDQLKLEVLLERHKQEIWKFNNTAWVDGRVVCSANMTCARVRKQTHE